MFKNPQVPTSNTGAPGPPELRGYSIGLQAAFQVLPRAATSSMDIVARWAGHGYDYHCFNRFAVVSKWFQVHVDPNTVRKMRGNGSTFSLASN